MTHKTSVDLGGIVDQLDALDERAIVDGVSRHFLEFELSEDQGEMRINGNSQGLIHFAKMILEVAASGMKGAHRHFDTTGIADRCDIPVVVQLKLPEWG